MRTCILTGLFLSVASFASAGETFDMNRTVKGVSQPQMHQNSQGLITARLHSTMVPEIVDDTHPFFGMSGECTGHAVIKAPSAQGAGICVYSNTDGDTALMQYSISGLTAEGGFLGTWMSLGGTGKVADVSGGGTWVNSTTTEDGAYTQQVIGAIHIP